MSIRVVTESHAAILGGDDYGYAASPEDVEALKNQISSLKGQISSHVTENLLRSKISGVEEKIAEVRGGLQRSKEELISTLQDGMWKQRFTQEMKDVLKKIVQRYSELNAMLDQKMVELARIGAIEANINAIFVDQAERLKKVIETETASFFENIQQSFQSKILSALIEESKKVTWDGEL